MNNVVANAGLAHVQSFCERVVSGCVPVTVDCRPIAGHSINECFPIVEQQVVAHGGQQLTGWAVWEVPGVFIEAEFHAVWRQPTGQLLCITPRISPIASILFVPDPSRTYNGRQVDNVRQTLVKDHDVSRFLYLSHRRFEILNGGDLANQHGVVALSKKASREYEQLEKDRRRLLNRLNKRYDSAGADI